MSWLLNSHVMSKAGNRAGKSDSHTEKSDHVLE
jgi:hypothetical protein